MEFIRRQMAARPVPIVIVSIAAESSERVLSGLDAGAIDFVQKPTALATEKVFDVADELVAKVVAAAGAPLGAAARTRPPRSRFRATTFSNRYEFVVIGVSTGGPQGLKSVIPRLPGGLSRAGGDCAAHADRVYRGLREAPRRGSRR